MTQPAYKLYAAETAQGPVIPASKSSVLVADIVPTIRAVGREAWNACYPDALENYDYLLAVEEVGIPGFTWNYALVRQGNRVLACMPAFLTDFSPLTTLDDGILKNLVLAIQRRFPGFLSFRFACLGSPVVESGAVGFHPAVPEAHKPGMLRLLLGYFERKKQQDGFTLIGIKDIPERQKALWEAAAAPMGYRFLRSMPGAELAVDFASMEEYMSRLSADTRKDMRRKLKKLPQLRIEQRTRLDDVLPEVERLYTSTKNRSDFQFEELTGSYFAGVLRHMGERAHCMLYFAGDKLLAFNLVLKDRQRLLDKFFCMDATAGRQFNLYFISWFTNLQYCLDHGIGSYQSGQAGYENKLRLGSTLSVNWLMFRHLNPVMNWLLRRVAPFLAIDREQRA